ncbi:hypothetical protein PVAND_000334 [Polypedilum vanderplanki]|uniref:3-hydroxyacyl-CoA dehydrogenase type-2 n=1 Tax=Polypedilum vanderplanki TaxID=319348 RepID=A0A9J6BK05_POLVA|nr:hypothetical protein PVAND_000334 [Polypedilum vanderplanki]
MFKNAVALVTGGGSGLGRAVVERFARAGSKVVIGDLKQSPGEELAKELGNNVTFVPMDVTSENDVNEALHVAKSKFGGLHVVVNSAAIVMFKETYDFKKKTPHSLNEFANIINVNLNGTFNVTRLAAGLIGENKPDKDGQRGVIINVSTVAAFDGVIGQAAYAASKAAVVGMTLPLARDLSSQGIRVVTIAPGFFDTPMFDSLPDKIRITLAKTVPFPQRLGYAEEFAHLVEAVVDNPMINGETIRQDGALRMMP